MENIQGIHESMIEQHEDMALIALVALIVLGVSAMAGIILTVRKLSFSILLEKVILFITIISFALVAWTGYLGGQIRHSELRSISSVQEVQEQSRD